MLDLPTGTGKTMIFLPVGIAASRKGYRTAILSSTKQSQLRLSKEIGQLDSKKADLVFGESEYHCPLIKAQAQSWCCREYKEDYCRPNNLGCGVIKSEDLLEQSPMLITNFAKFLMTPRRTQFDLVILDDSHSFESAREQASQVTLFFGPLRELFERLDNANSMKQDLGRFLSIYAEIFARGLPPEQMLSNIPVDYIKRFRTEVFNRDEATVRKEISSLSPDLQNAFWSIFYFIQRCQRASVNEFFIRRDYYIKDDYDGAELIAKPTNEQIASLLKRKFGSAEVVFATATPGDIKGHAAACTTRDYETYPLRVTPDPASLEDLIRSLFEIK